MTIAALCRTIATMPLASTDRQPAARAEAWFAREPGAGFVREALRLTAPELTRVYGHAGLYLRPCAEAPAALSGNMLHSLLRLHRAQSRLGGDLRCADEGLPLVPSSLALVYALHMLESSPEPEGLVREVARLLRPEGVAMFVVLNPFGLARLRWATRGPRAIDPATLEGWARAAGLEPMGVRHLGPLWAPDGDVAVDDPRPGVIDRLRSSYLLKARRRDAALTPLRGRRASLAFQPGVQGG